MSAFVQTCENAPKIACGASAIPTPALVAPNPDEGLVAHDRGASGDFSESVRADLRFLGVPRPIRDALAILPEDFAAAFLADARRAVESEAVPVKPTETDEDALPPVPDPWGVLTMGTIVSPPGCASLATMRWRIVTALMRLDAGRLRAYCNGFRYTLAAWRLANGRDLVPAGSDWPPLELRAFHGAD